MQIRPVSLLTAGESEIFLKDVIGIVFFAVLAGNDEWTDIADFAMDEKKDTAKISGTTQRDSLSRYDTKSFFHSVF